MLRQVGEAFSLLNRSTRLRVAASIVGSVLVAGLDMVAVAVLVPFMNVLTGQAVDAGPLEFLIGDVPSEQLLPRLGLVIVGAFALKSLVTIAIRWWQLGFLASETVRTSTRLLRGYLTAPYELHLERSVPDLLRRLGDGVGQMYGSVIGGSLAVIAESATILGLATVLLVTSPIPALLAIAYIGLIAATLSRMAGPRAVRAGETVLDSGLTSFKSALHSLGGIKEIMVRRNSEVFVARYGRAQLEVVHARRRLSFLGEAPKYALELAFITGVALLAAVTFATEGPGAAAASLAVFVAAGFRVLPSVVRLIGALTAIRGGIPNFEIVKDDLPKYAVDAPDHATTGASLSPVESGDLVFSQVSYTYPGRHVPVLADVTFTVPSGTSVGVVGPSGAGKTTLINLVLGLLEPSSGQILVGGRPLRRILPQWQLGIGLVPQTVYAFDGTLRENIVFEEGRGDDRRLLQAVHDAELDDLIEAVGLDVVIGDRGVGLSGGQQQRIGIARALYHRPQVLVLDEATSALDNITEHAVTSALQHAAGVVTTFVVAHRLSTVRRCDQIIFLDGGRLAAAGTFDEVLEANEKFAKMVRLGSLDRDIT